MILRFLFSLLFVSSTLNFAPVTHGSIITRTIEAQKALIAREEALLEQTKAAVKDAVDGAVDVTRETLANVAEHAINIATFPVRVGSRVIDRSKDLVYNTTQKLWEYSPIQFSISEPKPRAAPVAQDRLDVTPQAAQEEASWTQRLWNTINSLPIIRVVFNTTSNFDAEGPSYEIETNRIQLENEAYA
ncbi:uncharacterized protein LOC129758012 [Uranotaenia lowii]|uniref:uncharacterized protein LOC129758012 n=1 Tax=Uranotaenia lowii TaxID=190385 RepID=UPI002478B47D|nr:uncharacterized protein LOC129758012 [Uranotaenia lowii]